MEQAPLSYGTQAHTKLNSDISEQFNQGKIGFTLHGQKLRGRFYLVKTSTENQWLLLKKTDEFDSEEDLTISKPDSVLTGRNNDQLVIKKRQISKSSLDSDLKEREKRKNDRYRKLYAGNICP